MNWVRERRVALTALTLFTLLAGDFWRYLLSWWGWGIVVAILLAGWVALAIKTRVDPRRIPIALAAFILVAALSTIWSAYPVTTLLAVSTTAATVFVGVIMAATVSLDQLLRALGVAARWIIGLSLLFEFVVATIIRRPILPLWVDYEPPIPAPFYWSRGDLFEVFAGGRIQGIVGNANLLGTVAALALIVFAVQLVDRRVPIVTGWFWIGASVVTVLLTESATITVVLAGCAFTLGVVVLARRYPHRRKTVYVATVGIGVLGTVIAIAVREQLLDLLGRSGDLTNRLGIWEQVIGLWAERPILGWGWISYWAPWVEPFNDLVIINGVTYLQAHSAWLDVAVQLGAVGLALFTVTVLTAVLRCASWSIDAAEGEQGHTAALRLLPALVMTLLVVQSFAESRLLVEAGLVLFTFFAVASMRAGLPPIAPSTSLPVRAPDPASR